MTNPDLTGSAEAPEGSTFRLRISLTGSVTPPFENVCPQRRPLDAQTLPCRDLLSQIG